MEAAGLGLAILPLVIEGFKAYSEAAEAVSTFKRYSYVIMDLKGTVRTQEILFNNSFEHLISTYERYRLLDTLDSAPLSDRQVRTNFHLQNSLQVCESSLLAIKRSLDTIVELLDGFTRESNDLVAAHQDRTSPRISIKVAFRRTLDGIRVAWSKRTILATVNHLRTDIRDFDRVSKQAICFMLTINPNAGSQPRESNIKGVHTTAPTDSMEIFKHVRQASRKIHSGLANHWLCHTHENHTVSICASKRASDDCLSFEAILAGYGSEDISKPIFMEMEADDQLDTIAMVTNATSSLKAFEFSPTTYEAMEFHSDSTPRADAEPCQGNQRVKLSIPESTQSPTDLTQIQDFCVYFQQQCETMQLERHFPGHFPDLAVQRIFSLGPDHLVSETPRSLAEIVASANERSPLSLPNKADIAASLAASVLKFYSTPWLPRSWGSTSIVFFEKISSITTPYKPLYFSIQLEQKVDKGKAVERGSSQSTVTLGGSSVRNEMLFQLGLLLLETGLSRPWDRIRQEVVKRMKTGERADDYHIANTLAHNELLSCMGPRYSRIVRKCLGCDFGLGESDFCSEELQAVFHRDVVLDLYDLNNSLAKFWGQGIMG